jgi:hypothetical protein
MDFITMLREKAFVGRDFLTWLWFKADQTGGRIEAPGKPAVGVVFLDSMTLDLADVERHQAMVLKGEQSELREGVAALREGKKISSARISVLFGDNEFAMTLQAAWFGFGSLRIPVVLPHDDADSDADGEFLDRINLIEIAMTAVDMLFVHFLELRMSNEKWDQELSEIQSWIEVEKAA